MEVKGVFEVAESEFGTRFSIRSIGTSQRPGKSFLSPKKGVLGYFHVSGTKIMFGFGLNDLEYHLFGGELDFFYFHRKEAKNSKGGPLFIFELF